MDEPKKKGRKPDIERYKRALALKNSGLTYVEIGKEMGVSKSMAQEWVHRAKGLKLDFQDFHKV